MTNILVVTFLSIKQSLLIIILNNLSKLSFISFAYYKTLLILLLLIIFVRKIHIYLFLIKYRT